MTCSSAMPDRPRPSTLCVPDRCNAELGDTALVIETLGHESIEVRGLIVAKCTARDEAVLDVKSVGRFKQWTGSSLQEQLMIAAAHGGLCDCIERELANALPQIGRTGSHGFDLTRQRVQFFHGCTTTERRALPN